MKLLSIKKSFTLVAALFVLLNLIFPFHSIALASETTESNQRVYDDAGLLSTSEISDLEKMCTDYGKEAGIEIMILTHNDPSAPYAATYIEDFNDKLPKADRVYILVDMHNRDVFMEGYGTAETYINSKRINTIIDEITPSLTNGDYLTAFEAYIKDSAAYMKDDSELNYDHNYTANTPQSSDPSAANYDPTWRGNSSSTDQTIETVLKNPLFQLVVALIIGGITVGVMAYNSGGRMTTGGSTYMDASDSGLIGRRDDYIRTVVTRVRRPQNNNNSGGGFNAGGFRGGMSAGGQSHSSGGGKF